MRTVALAASRSILVIGLFVAALGATAASAADKNVITSPNADYSGFDYSTVKNVTVNQCQTACLADNKCAAFTYNTKASWCFLKSDFSALSSSPGSTAGRVVAVAAVTPTLEQTRLGELNFLTSDLIDESRAIIGDLKTRYPNIHQAYAALRTAGAGATHAGKVDDAAADFGQALVLANEDPAAWLDFARASLARTSTDDDKQTAAWTDASAAAIDAYLRTDAVADRASELAIIGDALGARAKSGSRPSLPTRPASRSSEVNTASATPTSRRWPITASASSTIPSRPIARPHRSAWSSPTTWR